jgi:hypothetical protein
MRGYVKTFGVPKIGATAAEYEDASWIGPDGTCDGDIDHPSWRVNIADGASESLLAGRWARHLVAAFGETGADTSTREGFVAAYQEAVEGWDAEVARYKEEREERDSPIKWYEEPGLAKGAYATLLAVEFRAGSEWTASALGDSCVFQVRDGELCRCFPMTSAADFSNQPPLLNSHGAPAETLNRYVARHAGDWEPQDVFYLSTDALAAWFLRAAELGQRPWEALFNLDTEDAGTDFPDWISELRRTGEIRDDDTTLVRVDVW